MSARAIGLVPHRDRPEARALAARTAQRLAAEGIEVRVPDTVAADLDEYAVAEAEFADGLDLVITFGGDGTMLFAVQLVYRASVPLIGVNLGQLAYLAELEPVELDAWVPRLVAGEFTVSERMVVEVDVTSAGPANGTWYALNEAVIEKQRIGHLIYLDVSINGTSFTSYAADGMIIASPTGSTAYTFSARGPIVSPRLRCLLLTPVSPHMLFDRSLVLDGEEELSFVVVDERTVVLTLDGRELGLVETGATITCTRGPQPARIVTFGPRDFHQILKAKFGLADR